MIEKVSAKNVLKFIKCIDGTTCTGMRTQTAYACYGLNAADYTFYIADNTAAICIAGGMALHCGAKIIDTDELCSFLSFMGVSSFISETMLFPQWCANPRLLMKCTAAFDNDESKIDVNPPLWEISKTIENADADAWYADACARTNKGYGAVHAISDGGVYVSSVYAQCISKNGIYLTSVQTLENYRKKGYARTLVQSFCKGDTVYAICMPQLRHFYEKCGFTLHVPICEYQPPQ